MSEQVQTFDEIRQSLADLARSSWSGGDVGEERANNLLGLLDEILPAYAKKLGYSQEEILLALEKSRSYCAVNFYQKCNFPNLDKITIFDNQESLIEACKSKKFHCPSCKGISTNPYECTSGNKTKLGDVCYWKSYGLFGCLGEGFSFAVRDSFLEHGKIETIFWPTDIPRPSQSKDGEEK